jgi:D-alanyl-D-alanine dipeptidase
VDLTLYDLKSGKAVEMTGRYDEMSPRSYADYVGGTSRQRWLRQLLRSAMEAQGFAVYPEEWWHFDYKDWSDYGIGNATFAQLAK